MVMLMQGSLFRSKTLERTGKRRLLLSEGTQRTQVAVCDVPALNTGRLFRQRSFRTAKRMSDAVLVSLANYRSFFLSYNVVFFLKNV